MTKFWTIGSEYCCNKMAILVSWPVDVIILITIFMFVLHKYLSRKFDYWEKRGVPFESPIPFFGNVRDLVFFKCCVGEWIQNLHQNAADNPFYGFFMLDKPYLMIKSQALIKKLMITDFYNFNNRTIAAPEHNEIEKYLLFMIKNPEWKLLRSKLSPLFTSARMKNMFNLMLEVSNEMNDYLENHLGDVEIKATSSRYSMDVIAQCAFGIRPNSFREESPEFWRVGKTLFDFGLRNVIAHTLFAFRPDLVNLLNVNFHNSFAEKYFINLFQETIDRRQGQVGSAHDLIDIINELRRKEQFRDDYNFDGPKLASQALQFFQAGYETTSTTISFALYELCMNPDIQSRLRDEILANINANGGLTWKGLNEMKYLDMIVAETLRKYPALPFLDRECNNDYVIPGTDIVIKKGMSIFVSTLGMHYDESIFPDPKKFDPGRFADGIIRYGTGYLPFGIGPRNCIGERFGRMASKIAICQIIQKFQLEKNSRTPDRVKFSRKSLLILSDKAVEINVKKYNGN